MKRRSTDDSRISPVALAGRLAWCAGAALLLASCTPLAPYNLSVRWSGDRPLHVRIEDSRRAIERRKAQAAALTLAEKAEIFERLAPRFRLPLRLRKLP